MDIPLMSRRRCGSVEGQRANKDYPNRWPRRPEAYAVIRDAMRHAGMVGMGRVVLAKRERPIIIEPLADGLRGITLRYAHEVRSEAEYFADIPKLVLPKEMFRLAEHIIKTKTADFDVAWLEDRYRTALV
jgi:DNA end-binding protein Ku